MSLGEALKRLEALGDERMRAQYRKHGSGDNQFGIRLGDIRKLATGIRSDPSPAIALWETGIVDARLWINKMVKRNR